MGYLARRAPSRGSITVPMFEQGVSGVLYAFGTRSESAPARLRQNQPAITVVGVNQVHGAEVLIINRPMPDAGPIAGDYDAIITDQPNILVTVRTADCVPILLVDPVRRVVAAVHAGWRGTLAGITRKTLSLMHERFGCRLVSIRAAIGPSIGRCCYEVGEAVLQPLRAYPDWRDVVEMAAPERGRLDLRRLNRRQMEESRVDPSHIEMVNLCTACHPDLFYSYRRDGKAVGKMTSGIALTAMAKH